MLTNIFIILENLWFNSEFISIVTRGYKPFKLYSILITLSSCCCSSASLSCSCLDRNIITVVVDSNTSNPISRIPIQCRNNVPFSNKFVLVTTRGCKTVKLYPISITLSSCCCSSASLSRSCLDRNIIIVVVESNTSNPISNFISWSNISFRKPLYWGQTEVDLCEPCLPCAKTQSCHSIYFSFLLTLFTLSI